VKRPLPTPVGDVALLATRVLLGVIMLAHGYQKLVVDGVGRTTSGFESMSIPLAIVSASFASFVEFVGGVLIVVGALTTTVVALDLVVMVGAAGFVHMTNGIFAQRNFAARTAGRSQRHNFMGGKLTLRQDLQHLTANVAGRTRDGDFISFFGHFIAPA